MEKTVYGSFFFQASSPDGLILAHDGAAFSEPFFFKAEQSLRQIRSLNVSPSLRVFPDQYQEDLVQASRRVSFSLSEWILAACEIDSRDAILRVLLVNRHSNQEGYIFNLLNSVVEVSFYRGFVIKETAESPSLSGEDFLSSLGYQEAETAPVEEDVPLYISYPEDEQEEAEEPIKVARPAFEANGKRKIINLGGSSNRKEEEAAPANEEAEESEETPIQVERPAFEAGGHHRPRNLGSSEPTAQEREEEDTQPDHIDIVAPSFVAGSNKKPRNLNATPDRPRPKKKPLPEIKETPIQPVFTPNNNNKPANLDEPKKPVKVIEKAEPIVEAKPMVPEEKAEAKPIFVARPSFEAAQKREIVNYDKIVEKENRHWSSDEVYKLKPNVFHGERSTLDAPSFASDAAIFSLVKEHLAALSSLPISNHLLMVPKMLDDGDGHFKDIFHFSLDQWDLLVLLVDSANEPLSGLISFREDPNFCLIVSLGKDPVVEVLSLTGASLDDRALPYLNFQQLLNLVRPKKL